jgi:hypothetical protein
MAHPEFNGSQGFPFSKVEKIAYNHSKVERKVGDGLSLVFP